MGRGRRSNRASHAADHADRRRRKSRTHPDRARDLLGAHGLRDDGRHHRRHDAHLLFLPALYVAWFRIKEPEPTTDNTHENPTSRELQADLSADAPSQREMEHA
jgi:hypothetical protein